MILIYTPKVTNRIRYVLDFIFKDYYGLSYELTEDPGFFKPGYLHLNYSDKYLPGYFSVFYDTLLLSGKIEKQPLFISRERGMPVIFQTTDNLDYRFDIFSAVFYLISRYEEYLPHEKDKHGRYISSNSILSNPAFHFSPVVETWLIDFKMQLLQLSPGLPFKSYQYEFEPTFDIDNAFAYKGRRFPKILGSLFNQKGIKTMLARVPDPYDTIDHILFYLEKFQLKGRFFFLLNDKGPYNSNVNPHAELLDSLIKKCTADHSWGIHASYYAFDDDLLQNEIKLLENITGVPNEHNRQHFLRISIPDYYNYLIAKGICHDHSLGYPDVSGFRAGFSRPFYWYDLVRDQQTSLQIHPFCFMDATYVYYHPIEMEQIIKKNLGIREQVSKVNGKLVMISHNDLLGIDSQVNFWRVFQNCAV